MIRLVYFIIDVYIMAMLITGISCTNDSVKQAAGLSSRTEVQTPTIEIVDPVFTEIKENTVSYNGEAVEAEYFNNEHKGIIINPRVSGLTSKGESFTASAEKGYYYDKNKTLTLKNNIFARLDSGYDLKCNYVDYFINKRIIVAYEPVTISSKAFILHADKANINLNTGKLLMEGNIKANIYNMSLK